MHRTVAPAAVADLATWRHIRAARCSSRGRRDRQDAADPRALRWLVEQGTMPDRLVLLLPSSARADAARARLEERLTDGYGELFVVTPPQLAATILRRAGSRPRPARSGPVAGRPAGDARRADRRAAAAAPRLRRQRGRAARRLRAPDRPAQGRAGRRRASTRAWAAELPSDGSAEAAIEREFAEIFRTHERMLAEAGACDDGDLVRLALRLVSRARRRPAALRARAGRRRAGARPRAGEARPSRSAGRPDGGRRSARGADALPRRRRGAAAPLRDRRDAVVRLLELSARPAP